MSIFYWILEKIIELVGGIVRLFPLADLTEALEILRPGRELIQSFAWLNEYLPLAEVAIGIGLCLSTLLTLYGVMLVRRTFSLIWPGAGS